MRSFREIRENTPFPDVSYRVTIGWLHLEKWFEDAVGLSTLEFDPDFQRPHVWTQEQQEAYIEYVMSGGPSGKILYWGCENWSKGAQLAPLCLVDGKQRLRAVQRFVAGEIRAFGQTIDEFPDKLRILGLGVAGFQFHVAEVSRVQMLRWYLALNSGGTPHTQEQLDKVRELLVKAES